MNKGEYEKIFKLEKDHWWYVGLRGRVFQSLKKYLPDTQKRLILDAGCGTGFSLLELEKFGIGFGIDVSEKAIDFCKKRDLNKLSQGSVNHLPYKNDIFDAIISLDVLYHKDVYSDIDVLKEFYRVLKPGGILVINVPAFDFMHSTHDIAIHTKRRYTVGSLNRRINETGLTVEKVNYRNIILFPLIMIFRMFKNFNTNSNHSESDLKKLPSWINKLLVGILRLENIVFDKIPAPFGLSVYCIAKKNRRLT